MKGGVYRMLTHDRGELQTTATKDETTGGVVGYRSVSGENSVA